MHYNVWWKSSGSNWNGSKMDLTIRMRMINNVKYRHAICLKFEERFFASSIMFGLEAKFSICSRIKKNLILNCRKFSAVVIAVIN